APGLGPTHQRQGPPGDTGGPWTFARPVPATGGHGILVTVTVFEEAFPSWTWSRAAFAGTLTTTGPSVAGVTSNLNVTLSLVRRFYAVPSLTARAEAVSAA